ncbi:RING finger protein 37-like [Ruditapes philippinarum]|uniref:RING finger protein 37-like n=1 Tax=Ruditapes philippinarum TaxID=129788 RepID=UPI00295BC9B2|nr:RING finger protein 37-like [Ruditapes philippinarum]
MLIDFCHHSVKSKIKADKVSFDGYEVQNLVSSNLENKRKGFLSDHFIKPPVNVTVQFPCNVCIYRIVIDPVIGQQKSCDLKIFTAAEKMTDSWLYSTNSDKTVKTDGVIFNYVGSSTQTDPSVICFVNNQFKERSSWRIENIPDVKSYPCVLQLNARKPGGLYSASHVTVCLSRSIGGKSAALRRLEIWGIPALKVPVPVQHTLRNAYIEVTDPKEIKGKIAPHKIAKSSELSNSASADKTSCETNKISIDGVSIPDDFIDQITFDLMTVPVLLPCGKNIDQSTLDRFVNTEASWGRLPSDPFTAVIFSPSSGPITNTSLKARIDSFVLKHSNSLKVPQTLGRSDIHKMHKSQIVSSKLVTEHFSDKSTCRYSVPEIPRSKPHNFPNVNSTFTNKSTSSQQSNTIEIHPILPLRNDTYLNLETPRSSSLKRKHSDVTLLKSQPNKNVDATKDHVCIDLTRVTNFDETIKTTKKQKLLSNSHDNDLSQSLDNALLSTLGNLPSFTKKNPKQATVDPKIQETQCSKCKSNLTKSDVIKYKLVCGHLICRLCLVQESTSFVCNVCQTKCQSSQAVRMF